MKKLRHGLPLVLAGDDAALAESFGQLTQTCVNCHSAYLSHRK